MVSIRWAAAAALACACTAWAAWEGGVDWRDTVTGVTAIDPTRSSGAAPRAAAATTATATASHFFLSDPWRFNPVLKIDDFNSTPYEMETVAIGDVTGDNRDDLIIFITSAPEVWVVVQRPDGTLDTRAPRRYPVSPYNWSISSASLMLGDLNEDGVLDIASSARDNSGNANGMAVLLSDGAGGLSNTYVPDTLDHMSAGEHVMVDADLDGHRDVVSYFSLNDRSCAPEPYISCPQRKIRYGDGKGGFPRRTQQPLGTGGAGIAYAPDLTGDGIGDLVLIAGSSASGSDSRLRVYANDRNGGYHAPTTHMPLGEMFAVGDFLRDGLQDIFNSWLHAQNESGGFDPPIGPFPEYWVFMTGIHSADLDRNGTPDVLSVQCEMGSYACSFPWMAVYLEQDGVLEFMPERPYFTTNVNGNRRQAYGTGDLNGDGCTDVVLATGSDGLLIFNGNNCNPARAARNDLNGDHASDVLWHNPVTGVVDAWEGASIDRRRIVGRADPAAWTLATTGDFDGDSRTDVLWRHRVTGATALWNAGNRFTSRALATVPSAAWRVVGSGDLDGDRKDDLLWQNTSTGQNVAWRSGNHATPLTLATVGDPAWRIAGIGDYDGDGRDDLFWRHATSGRNAVWKSGNAATASTLPTVPLNWSVTGTGDFDGDGVDDLLWRRSDGANSVWRSANASTTLALPALTDAAFRVAAVGDFDNDTHADILWRHAQTGYNVLWREGNAGRQRFVKAVGTHWSAVP